MIILGLTGSIGMGKSTVAEIFRRKGLPVHCSDEAVHALLSDDKAVMESIAAQFPAAYNRREKRIDRAALGALVFASPGKREALELIIHPRVVSAQADFLAVHARRHTKIAVLDIPLLFETGAEERVDYTVVVTAPDFIQRQHVLARPGMTEEKFMAIRGTQMPDAEKKKRADFVINTGLGLAVTRREVDGMLRKLAIGGAI